MIDSQGLTTNTVATTLTTMRDEYFTGRVLTVAGMDPTCGAGLPLDIRMITHLGGIPQAAVTAITVQDTAQVTAVQAVTGTLVAQQMCAALDDIGVDCIKLGMLATADIVKAVVEILERYPNIPVVADPVLAGTGGGVLLDLEGVDLWRSTLLPRVTLVTPNLPEARILTAGMVLPPAPSIQESMAMALGHGGGSVLLKGGHGSGHEMVDFLWHQGHGHFYRHPRLEGGTFHGTGCALASAIATFLALGSQMEEAVAKGLATVVKAMENGLSPGRGQRLLNMFGRVWPCRSK